MERQASIRTSAHLRELLSTRPEYAERWRGRIGRKHSQALHQSAICHVIAEYLWENGLHPKSDEELPRKLKDRVHRGLSGQSLSRGTVRWFIEAFEMSRSDTEALLRLSAHRTSDTILGGLELQPGTLPPRRHRTVSLHEWHSVGPDGLPDAHRTAQVIEATEALDSYPYIFDTDAATVRVVRGGRAGRPYSIDNGLFAVDIELDRPLAPGETAAFEYVTTFWYRTPPAPEFRRASTGRIDNLEMRVQFHHLRLPSQVWWSVWASLDGEPTSSEPVSLDADKTAHRSLASIEATIVGFRWTMAQR